MILFIQGQEPLTVSMLFEAPTAERKEILGERLYILIKAMLYPDPELIGKITGMLLEMDDIDLLHLTQHQGSLKSKVQEAVKVLEEHFARDCDTSAIFKNSLLENFKI